MLTRNIRSNRLFNGLKTLTIALALAMLSATTLFAASAKEIDTDVNIAMKRFHKEVPGADSIIKSAKGVLVFPSVIKAGFGIGGEYGEGALLVAGKTVDYYNTAAVSIGFQLGAQSKSIVIMFLTKDALAKFRKSEGWKAGVDGSVALLQVGAGDSIDTENVNDPIIAFIFGQKGLMYNLTLEGSKFTKMDKSS
jgi:lipid-binding SYLF domain-containing protein